MYAISSFTKRERRSLTEGIFICFISSRLLITLLGWVFLAFLCFKIYTVEVPVSKNWDPYEILGIDTVPIIKFKLFVELLRTTDQKALQKKIFEIVILFIILSHPDKIFSDDPVVIQEAQEKFIDFAKAYKVLTDPEIRQNYEEYGHPDGKQQMEVGIALPTWIVDAHNNKWVLSFYAILLGVLLPFYVGKWWYKSTKYNKDHIMNNTMALFFKDIKEHLEIKDLHELVSAAAEFTTLNLEETDNIARIDSEVIVNLWNRVKLEAERNLVIVEASKKYTGFSAHKALTLILAHLYRVDISDKELLEHKLAITTKAAGLVYALIQISLAYNWVHTTILAIDFSQMIIQALPYKDSPLLQLPYLTRKLVRQIKSTNKNVKSVLNLMELRNEERRNILKDLDDQQYNEVVKIAGMFPVLKLVKCELRVIGDEVITPKGLITCIVKLQLQTVAEVVKTRKANSQSPAPPSEKFDSADNDFSKLDDIEEADVGSFLKSQSDESDVPPVYSPYFAAHKQAHWWVIIGDLRNGRMIVNPQKVTNLCNQTSLKFQFQGPPDPGSYSFNLFVKSDSYLGCDIREELDFTVIAEDKDKYKFDDSVTSDEISEPEFNTYEYQKEGAANVSSGIPLHKTYIDFTSSDEE